jgi:hypothetical protein
MGPFTNGAIHEWLGLFHLEADVDDVAFSAPIGGFIFGAVVTLLFLWVWPQPPGERRCQLLYGRAMRA